MDTRMIVISRSHLYSVLELTRKEARARKSRSSKSFSVSTKIGFLWITSGIALELDRKENQTPKSILRRGNNARQGLGQSRSGLHVTIILLE